MTIKELLNKGYIILKTSNVESPKLKSRLLLQYILKKDRQELISYDIEEVSKKDEERYMFNLKKIINGIPIQYITNTQEFMKMQLYINENVLIPQPDTEILVEETIKLARYIKNPVVLDLCTGSGAIAISLAKYLNNIKVYATDISLKALEVAKINAKRQNVEDKIEFIESDLFNRIDKNLKFDIIVSNPPYIRTDVIKELNLEVKNEPRIALDGGSDGLDFYKKIVKESINYLKYNSYLCLEIGYDQKIDVIELIENEKNYTDIKCKKDLYDNDRVIISRVGD